ncbi:hypothetical protein [Salinigranum sp.]|uniref:hypothetical protein n=1 Tax=Salinigranum sp. TaxID=1966351 RepID=UPI003562DB62
MPSTPTRRRLLAGIGSVALAGCLGGDGETAPTTRSTQTQPTTAAETETGTGTATPVPPREVEADLPTSEFGPPYPPLSVDSAALAIDFALTFEEALQRNRVPTLEPDATYTRLDSADATDPESTASGYLVGVRVVLSYGREVHTSDDPDVESFDERRSVAAAYFVGDRAVRVRTESLTVVDPRESPDGEVVACAA